MIFKCIYNLGFYLLAIFAYIILPVIIAVICVIAVWREKWRRNDNDR